MKLERKTEVSCKHMQWDISIGCACGCLLLSCAVCRWQRRTCTAHRGVWIFFSYFWILVITLQPCFLFIYFSLNALKYNNMTKKEKKSFKVWKRYTCRRFSFLSWLRLPSFIVIGESQSTPEDNNLPFITVLPTLVWLRELSLTSINQEVNPWGYRINQQTLARSLHFSDNEDRFIIISHSTQYKTSL